MRRILVCTGVLGGGTALVFTLAALTALAFPQGATVSSGWNGDVRVMDDLVIEQVAPAVRFGNPVGGWTDAAPAPEVIR